MQTIVKGRNTRVSKGVKDLATAKLERVGRYLDRIQMLEIEFSEEHNPRITDKHTVEVTLTAPAHTIRASASGPDQASAVDRVLDRLERQVKRVRGKVTKRGERTTANNRVSAPASLPSPSELLAGNARNGSKSPIESSDELEQDETGERVIQPFGLIEPE